jgi:hypothetical protein
MPLAVMAERAVQGTSTTSHSYARRRDEVEVSRCGYFWADAFPRPISAFTVRRIRDALDNGPAGLLPVEIGPRRWLEAAFGISGELEPDPFRIALAAFQLV